MDELAAVPWSSSIMFWATAEASMHNVLRELPVGAVAEDFWRIWSVFVHVVVRSFALVDPLLQTLDPRDAWI